MIIKTCRKGHDLTADQIMKDGRCCICAKEKRQRRKLSGKEKAYKNEYRKRLTTEQKEKERDRIRRSKRKAVLEGRRDYAAERAKKIGVSREEYIAIQEAKVKAAAIKRNIQRAAKEERKLFLASLHDSHVKQYKKTPEYSRAKVKKNYYKHRDRKLAKKKRSVNSLSPGYVAYHLGGRVAEIPAPLLMCYREVIRARRLVREIQQH